MKTPTLAQLRKLAKKKGCVLELWDVAGLHMRMKDKVIMYLIWRTYYSVGPTITKRQGLVMALAALSALPDAEKAKGGA